MTPARTRGDSWILGLVLVVGIGALLLIGLAAQPDDARRAERAGSTHVSTPGGAKALYEYLARAGLESRRVTSADLSVPPGAALVVLEASLEEPEIAALLERVEGGLPLLVASSRVDDPFWAAAGLPVAMDGVPGRTIPAFPSPAVREVERVETSTGLRAILGRGGAGDGWIELLADDAGAIAVSRRLGAGELVVLLDPAVLSNGGLAKAHNLRFADAAIRHLAGTSRTVVFDEYHHGFGVERTVIAWVARAGFLPAVWLAGLVLVMDAIRRNRVRVGPPRPPPEPERRAVREFIGSYAALLRSSRHHRWAVRALERSLRRRLNDVAGIPFHAPPAAVFKRLAVVAPSAAARAYRALERAAELGTPGAERTDRDLLDLARDVHGALAALDRRNGSPRAAAGATTRATSIQETRRE